MTPRDVVRMLVPSPPSTGGTSVLRKYTRRPGRLMRSTPVMHLLAVRAVLQKDADHLPRRGGLGRLGRFLVDELEALDVALVLENLGDLDLQLRGRHIHPGMLRDDGIAEAREHIGNRICHISSCSLSAPRLSSSFQRSRSSSYALDSWQLAAPSTSCSSSRPRRRPAAPACGSRGGTARTCAGRRAAGRTDGSGSADGPCTSESCVPWRSLL